MRKQQRRPMPSVKVSILIMLLGALLACPVYFLTNNLAEKIELPEMAYNTFEEQLQSGDIIKAYYTFGYENFYVVDKSDSKWKVNNPDSLELKREMLKLGVEVEPYKPELTASSVAVGVVRILPPLLMVGFVVFYLVMMFGMLSGKNHKYNVKANSTPITFNDIAGQRAQKEQMGFLVDFLRNPARYNEHGARLPKGILLYGPSGTGKTLMARAVAGEAGVAFLTTSASGFVEMFVGRGASRIRSLFKEAKAKAPCVVFIDELDAIGKRDSGSGGSREYTQTINELLIQLDGFQPTEGIVVIGATNRVNDIDDSLLRSGRFDEHIGMPLPDRDDRLELLQLYCKDKAIGNDIDLEVLAGTLNGMNGADIANLINKATIIMVQECKSEIDFNILDKAMLRVMTRGLPLEVKGREDIQRLTAYHEAGHAVATKLLTKITPYQMSIVPNTSGSGGHTITPHDVEGAQSEQALYHRILILYAGRAAEELYLNSKTEATTGASEDIRQATIILRRMITEFGMSPLGLINFKELLGEVSFSGKLLQLATQMSNDAYMDVLSQLREYRQLLDEIAESCVKSKTLTKEELDQIFGRYILE